MRSPLSKSPSHKFQKEMITLFADKGENKKGSEERNGTLILESFAFYDADLIDMNHASRGADSD